MEKIDFLKIYDNLYAKEEEKMPEQKKFFVLYKCCRGFPGVVLRCIVEANSPEEVAQLLQGQYSSFNSTIHDGRCRGTIFFPKELFQPASKLPDGTLLEDGLFLEYKCGCLHLFISKDENGVKISLEELPIMGECDWYKREKKMGITQHCDEVGTLLVDCQVLCPDAYRLLVDDTYQEDKKDK